MNLVESYDTIKPSIVAFTPKFYRREQPQMEFPPIIGTGFIVDEGLVVTNDHVINAVSKLYKPEDCPPDVWPFICLLLHNIPNRGLATIPLECLGVLKVSKFKHGENYYGPNKPDVGFVHVKMKNLPKVNLRYNLKHIKEGRDIATSGFPMGTDTLTAPGYLHQLTPTLQKGIISAVLPFPCNTPHALMVNVMVQGGASGSPVFLLETGEVIGVLYASLQEDRITNIRMSINNDGLIISPDLSSHRHLFKAPTSLSYVVPAHFLETSLKSIKNNNELKFPENTQSLDEYIHTATTVTIKPGNIISLDECHGAVTLKNNVNIISDLDT